MNYFIADTHFGHENIMKHCNRPFATVAEMDETIIRNINSIVTTNDDLWILGDFCHWNPKACNPAKYLSQIKGQKHLIIGNHDKSLVHDKNAARYLEEMKPYAEIKDNGRKIVLTHYPLAEWNGFYHGDYHIHGHIHNNFNNPVFAYMATLERAFNVGVDVIGFTPRTLDELIVMKKKGLLYGENDVVKDSDLESYEEPEL